MKEQYTELRGRLVVGRKSDGRSVYGAAAERELIVACLKQAVSAARMAMERGVNRSLLTAWSSGGPPCLANKSSPQRLQRLRRSSRCSRCVLSARRQEGFHYIFFKTLKVERIYQVRCRIRSQTRSGIADWIEGLLL
jgi:hypothetical protein